MSSSVDASRWGRQPGPSARVNPALNPIVAYNFDSGVISDHGVYNLHAAMEAGTFSPVPNKDGTGLAWGGGRTRAAVSSAVVPVLPAGTPLTILARVKPTSVDTSSDTLIQIGKWAATQHGRDCAVLLNTLTTGNVYWAFNSTDYYTGTVFSAGQYIDIACVYYGGTLSTSTVAIYVNGISKSITKSGVQFVPAELSLKANARIARDNNSTARDFRGNIDYAYAFVGAWSQGQIQDFNARPWSIYLKSDPWRSGRSLMGASGNIAIPLGHHRLDNQYMPIAASRLNGVLQ